MIKNNDNDGLTKIYKEIGPYLGLGTQLAATIGLLGYFGYFLDGKLNTYPFLLILFLILGCGVGIYNFIKTTINLNKKKKS